VSWNGAGDDLRIRVCRLSIRAQDWEPNSSIYCSWTIGWSHGAGGAYFGADYLYAQLSANGPSEMPDDLPGIELPNGGGSGGGGGTPPTWTPPEPAGSIENADIYFYSPDAFITGWAMSDFTFDDAICVGQPASPIHIPVGKGDIDGDGDIDFIFYNPGDYSAQAWIMQDGYLQDAVIIGYAPYPSANKWKVLGVGDVNGDGNVDIVWHRDDGGLGKVRVWLLNGTTVIANQEIGISPGFEFLGLGDLNADGKSDILWRLINGVVVAWRLDGTTPAMPLVFGGVGPVALSWKAEAFCDLDNDGDCDIVWRSTETGQVKGWIVDNFARLYGGAIVPKVTSAWHFGTTVDLDNDGDSDLVWHNTVTGMVNAWQMQGLTKVSGGPVEQLGPAWTAW